MQIIQEYHALNYTSQMIKESRAMNDGKIIMGCILQRADSLNQNGRIYPRHILERETRNYQKFILENRALGELDHPETSVVELKNVSHVIREATMGEDGVVMGRLELLNTPSGKILQSLVESGIKLGISSRGVGSTVKEGDHQVVQEDFQLICFDVVSEPSTPNAFLVKEGKELCEKDLLELKKFYSKSDRLYRIANDIIFHR